MYLGKKVLAVVPARSGSKGVPDKNMKILGGLSLIARAAECLNELDWLDAKVLSTDSNRYADEGKKYGLQVPFLRPDLLSSDTSTAIDTMVHSLQESEKVFDTEFDILLIIEPTSPFRMALDIEGVCRELVENNVDSVVCVSPLDSKCHPAKALIMQNNKLQHYEQRGKDITARQELETLYARNGICYAITKECLLNNKDIITDKTRAFLIERHIVNIDKPIDIEWAEFLIQHGFGELKV
jgi:CMP-N,N'-diacetyllegionaminic acid synthase